MRCSLHQFSGFRDRGLSAPTIGACSAAVQLSVTDVTILRGKRTITLRGYEERYGFEEYDDHCAA